MTNIPKLQSAIKLRIYSLYTLSSHTKSNSLTREDTRKRESWLRSLESFFIFCLFLTKYYILGYRVYSYSNF
jgi:hypothetical protein